MRNLLGQRFGKLVVLERAGSEPTLNGSYARWLVRCDCGTKFFVRGTNLGKGTKSCGCLRAEKAQQHLLADLLYGYKYSAAKRGYAWDLSDEEFMSLTTMSCHYCGRAPSNGKKRKGQLKHVLVYSGIDRKDNLVGYTPENTIPACSRCNKAKGTMSYDEFLGMVTEITQFQTKISTTAAYL